MINRNEGESEVIVAKREGDFNGEETRRRFRGWRRFRDIKRNAAMSKRKGDVGFTQTASQTERRSAQLIKEVLVGTSLIDQPLDRLTVISASDCSVQRGACIPHDNVCAGSSFVE